MPHPLFSKTMIKGLADAMLTMPTVVFLILGPGLPVAQAALTITPNTPGGSDSVTIRSYRPDLDLDSDDNGVLDWVQIANGQALDGVRSPASVATQKVWLAANPGKMTDMTPRTAPQQEKAALQAVLDANGGGLPPAGFRPRRVFRLRRKVEKRSTRRCQNYRHDRSG